MRQIRVVIVRLWVTTVLTQRRIGISFVSSRSRTLKEFSMMLYDEGATVASLNAVEWDERFFTYTLNRTTVKVVSLY